jgi:hypothetical protein
VAIVLTVLSFDKIIQRTRGKGQNKEYKDHVEKDRTDNTMITWKRTEQIIQWPRGKGQKHKQWLYTS